jgi:hypothetical protein
MEKETKNFWNTKTEDLNVGDFLKLNVLTSVVVIGTPVLIGIGYSYSKDAVVKVKEIQKNRRKNKLKIVS